jgi:hypothetical protein
VQRIHAKCRGEQRCLVRASPVRDTGWIKKAGNSGAVFSEFRLDKESVQPGAPSLGQHMQDLEVVALTRLAQSLPVLDSMRPVAMLHDR